MRRSIGGFTEVDEEGNGYRAGVEQLIYPGIGLPHNERLSAMASCVIQSKRYRVLVSGLSTRRMQKAFKCFSNVATDRNLPHARAMRR